MADNSERVQIESRAALRAWLMANHNQSNGIWLVTFKKHCGERHVPYDAVVEEVLCFGWIDSLPRKLDDERSMLYLSPRRKGSPWSRLNKGRIEKLLAQGLIEPAGLRLIEQAQQDGTWTVYDEAEDLTVPDDLAAALAANPTAQGYWDRFSPSSRKGILWWIKSAKSDATRQKRIVETVTLAEQNLKANHPRQRAKG
jgi:uncharacterized protein YdeI (YjbR/CyaY-like superfamily)